MKDNRRSAAARKRQFRRSSISGNESGQLEARSFQKRNATLDLLRAVAILLMIIDHVANFWLQIRIEWDSIRLPTRLSMPLFAILMGYFIASESPVPWRRLIQVAAVSAIVNCFFYPLYNRLEILASLLAGYMLVFGASKFSPFIVLSLFFLPWDPSANLFDYPISLVAANVAQGQLLRRYDWKIGLAASLLACLAVPYLDTVAKMSVLMLPVATLLVIIATKRPAIEIPILNMIGRYPLTIYMTHYLIVLGLRPE